MFMIREGNFTDKPIDKLRLLYFFDLSLHHASQVDLDELHFSGGILWNFH